jgi:hypothetical protein
MSVTPQMGQLAGQYAEAYPWLDPAAMQAFVQMGVPADSAGMQQIATLAAGQAAEDGKFETAAEDVPDAWYEALWKTATDWAKPAVRTGFTILATPFEEVQALLSSAGTALFDETEAGELGLASDPLGNLGALAGELVRPDRLLADFWSNYTEKAARSGGLLALGDLLQGKHVDLGQGFLPGGEIWEEREKAKQRLRLDGQFVTPGRIMARQVAEPGTGQYQLLSGLTDFAQNIALDPTNLALGGLAKSQKAVRQFRSVGAIPGVRKTVDTATAVDYFLTSNPGRKVVSALTENRDVYAAWKAIGQPSGGLDIARRLADTTDESATFQVLSDILGLTVRERPSARFVSAQIERAGRNEFGQLLGGGARAARADDTRLGFLGRLGRLGEDMPNQKINIHDPDDAALQLDRWMVNAQIPEATRARRIGELAGVQPDDPVAMFETTRRIMDDTEGLLVTDWGLKPARARSLTSMYERLADDLHTFDVDDMGRHVDTLAPLRVTVDGAVVDVRPTPGMISELVNDFIPLPDAREIRRATPLVKQMQGLYESGLWKGSVDFADMVMSNVWKKLQLLRGAYTVRVVGEEQVRMAGSGLDSLISHPFSAIAWNLSVDPKSRLGRRLATAAERIVDPKGTVSVTGEVWDDIAEHASAMSRGSAGHAGLPGEVLTGRFVMARQGDQGFFQGWATELAHEANDPIMRRVAGGLEPGDLRSIGREASDDMFADVSEWWWKGTGQKWRRQLGSMEGRSGLLTDRTFADGYLRQNFFDRLQRFTGGDPDLVNLIGTGALDDVSLKGFGHTQKLARKLEDGYAAGAPNFVKTPESVMRLGAGAKSTARLNNATERAFDALMSRPTNWLSRSPTFRQKYWQRVEELVGSADQATQHAMIRAAKDANVDFTGMLSRATRGSFDPPPVTPGLTRAPRSFLEEVADPDNLADAAADAAGARGAKFADPTGAWTDEGATLAVRSKRLKPELSTDEFLDDIRANGIQTPIRVGYDNNGVFEIVDGHHRLWAAQQLEIDEVPVVFTYWGDLTGRAHADMSRFLRDDVDLFTMNMVEDLDASQVFRTLPWAKIKGLTNLDDVDVLAKSFALSETKKLLYDLQKRSQVFDMMRLVFPFGEAWKEIITSWGSILRQNPSTIRRFQQGLEGARQPSLLGEAETTPGSGEGFFHTDPNTGEEVFSYPGGGILSKMLGLGSGGAGVELIGMAKGLNVVSATTLPGFGPIVQLPASHLIPNTPNWDTAREILLPFGEQESFIDSFTPAWLDKMKEVFSDPDPQTHRLFANTVADTMRALAATGEYDTSSAEGQQQLLDDATAKAKILYVIRGAAQSVVPTGPSFSWNTQDVQGNVVPVKLLSDDMRALTEEYGGDRTAAFNEWVKRYGVNNVLSIIGKSTAIVERPVTEKGDAWLRAHAGEERDFASTIGFFAPEPAVGEFDYTAYVRSFETGAREGVSPEEQLDLANDFLGRVQFEQAKQIAAARPGPESSLWLAQVRQMIAEQYPGFDGWVSRSIWEKKPKPDELIAELRSAVLTPSLAQTDAGQGIRKYLSAIDAANQMVVQLPGNTRRYQQAKSAAPIRAWLRSVAKQIIEEHPDFERSWMMVFERELADDDFAAAA